MVKWADFLISAVRRTPDRERIDQVRFHEDLGDQVGPPGVASRTQVVADIKSGRTYCTIIRNTQGKWEKGNDVHVVAVGRDEFPPNGSQHGSHRQPRQFARILGRLSEGPGSCGQ